MVCSINLLTQMLPGAGPGGVWTQDGYNLLGIGNPYIGGGTDFDLFGDDPLVDPSGAVAGYYFFSYDDTCNPPQQVVLYIGDGANAGDDVTINACISSVSYDLNDYLTGDAGGEWILSPLSTPLQPGVTVNDIAPLGDIETLSGNVEGTFVLIYQVTTPVPDGYAPADCGTCSSIATVTINVRSPFNAGDDDVFVVIPDTNGSFNLYDYLEGTPDTSGTWTQDMGDTPVDPTGGYLGTINLDGVNGCHYRFTYTGGFTDDFSVDCGMSHFVDITIIRDFDLNITQVGSVLTANYTGCSAPEFEWFKDDGGGFLTTGVTTQTFTVVTDAVYKVVFTCYGCTQEATYNYVTASCLNTPCFNLAFNETTGCITATNTGTNTSPVSADSLQWKKDGGAYAAYTGPICGCDSFEFADVVPYCLVVGGSLRFGFNGFTSCPGRSISQNFIEFGNGTNATQFPAGNQDYYQRTPAQWIALGRTCLMRIRVSTPLGYIFKRIQFTYTGTGGTPSCSDVTVAELNDPRLYYKIWVKRTVTYSDGCPPVTCESFYQQNNGCILEVYLTKANVSNPPIYTGPAIAASFFNNTGAVTYVWKKDGVVLAGETLGYVPTTYGNGVYEVIVTDAAGCVASDTLVLSTGCTIGVQITQSGSTLTGTVSGCGANPITRQWYFFNGTSWITLGTGTTQATSSGNGTYRMTATCGGCTAESTYTYTGTCTATVSIGAAGTLLTATPSGCSGSPSYQWQFWNGTSWTNVGTGSTYTVVADGLHRVNLTCGGCTATAQYNYTSPSCSINVTITPTGLPINPTLTANPTGCGANPVTYLWERYNGTSWVFVANTAATTATVAGSQYRITITCGVCSDYAIYYYSGCSTAVVISITGGGTTLTATPSSCSGTPSYVWELSLNGGASYAVIAPTTATITPSQNGLYRVTVTCSGDGCTAQDTQTFTLPCATTLSLAYASGTLTATTGGCAGVLAIVWQYSPNYDPVSGGCTGWTQVATGVTSYVPTVTGCYRVITTCDGDCFQERTLYIVIANPCAGLTMSVVPTIGKVSWDVLKLSGVPVTNYLISWRTSPGGVEVFRSGAGSYYNPATMYPHPSSNIPLPVGAYYPYILNSDAGNNLNCLPVFNVAAVQCGTDYSLSYSGAGGIAATQNVSVAVDAGTGYIKLGFQTQTIADKVQVKYNGVTIFDSGNIVTGYSFVMFVVPITFVVGQNYADVIVTNSTPAQQTNFRLYINCCNSLSSCPLVLDTTSVIATLNPSCGCVFTNTPTYMNFYPDLWSSLCQNVDSYQAQYLMQVGGCGVQYLPSANLVCNDCANVTTSKPIGVTGVQILFPFACSTRYASIKARLLSITDVNTFVDIQLKSSACIGDGAFTTIRIWPSHGTLIFDDVTRKITYEMDPVNPYTNTCTDCETLLYQFYENYLNLYSNAGNPVYGSYQSVYSDRAVTVAAVPTVDLLFNEIIVSDCGTTERRYKIDYRDDDCPCASWQLWEDVGLVGSYTTLIDEAAGWTGVCP